MTLIDIANAVVIGCCIAYAAIALTVIGAALIPASPRPAPEWDGQVTWTDPPTGSLALPFRPDVVVDRILPGRRALPGRATTNREQALELRVEQLTALLYEAEEQLQGYHDATRPTPVVLDEQPTGGER